MDSLRSQIIRETNHLRDSVERIHTLTNEERTQLAKDYETMKLTYSKMQEKIKLQKRYEELKEEHYKRKIAYRAKLKELYSI